MSLPRVSMVILFSTLLISANSGRCQTAETPQAEALRAVLNALDVRLSVRQAPASRLVAVLDTPRGRVELAGS